MDSPGTSLTLVHYGNASQGRPRPSPSGTRLERSLQPSHLGKDNMLPQEFAFY